MCFGSTESLQHTYHGSDFEEILEACRGKNTQEEKLLLKTYCCKPEIFLSSFSLANSKDKWTHGCANIQGLCGLRGWKTEGLWALLNSDNSKFCHKAHLLSDI